MKNIDQKMKNDFPQVTDTTVIHLLRFFRRFPSENYRDSKLHYRRKPGLFRCFRHPRRHGQRGRQRRKDEIRSRSWYSTMPLWSSTFDRECAVAYHHAATGLIYHGDFSLRQLARRRSGQSQLQATLEPSRYTSMYVSSDRKPTREFSAGSSFCGLVNTRDPVRVGGQGAATETPHLQISVYSPLLGKGLWELKAVVNQCQSVLLVAKGNSFARRERTRLSHEPGWCTSLISRFSSRSATALQVCKKYKTSNADEILKAQQHPQKKAI